MYVAPFDVVELSMSKTCCSSLMVSGFVFLNSDLKSREKVIKKIILSLEMNIVEKIQILAANLTQTSNAVISRLASSP